MTVPPQQAGAFIVTLKDVWMEVNASQQKTADALSSMSASVADMAGRIGIIADAMQRENQHTNDLEVRVRGLERWRYQLPISLGASMIALAAVVIDAISRIR